MGIVNPSIGRIYKVYSATISQVGINPPTVTILENDIGNIVWEYLAAGNYTGTLVGAFPVGRCLIWVNANGQLSVTQYLQSAAGFQDVDHFLIQTCIMDFFANTCTATDGMLSNHTFECRVYP